ncbi:MAG: efflux RND transporter permease subunit [Jannaschia sp.]
MSTWAIRRPIPSIALFLVLLLLGLVSFFRLPVTQFPNIDIPIINVTISQAGAAPAEVANQIVEPIEAALSDVVGVRHLTAVAQDGSATITVEFELEVDTDRALSDVKDAVANARGDLPAGIEEPSVTRVDVTGAPILSYAVSDTTRSIEELSTLVDDVIARDLVTADGVGKVTRIGGASRAIEVELEPDRLLALGLTASDVNDQLRQSNVDLGGGSGVLGGTDFAIRALGAADTVEQLRATSIRLASGGTVRLDQIARVVDGSEEATGFAMSAGQPVVAFSVFRATGESDLTAGEATKARLATLQQDYPDLVFSLIDDATVYTEGNYHSAMETLYEGAALAIIVVFIFLRNWRATVITAVALPLSIIPTFIVMNYLGFSLNTVSLLGITLVTGILVDDAIVEIENIVRHIQMGKPAYEASEEAAGEIGMTVVAISFTIVAVFLPVSFMSGIAGQYFRQFGLTVAVAVLFSLLVARLITPMMAAYFLRDGIAPEEEQDGWLMRRYMGLLRWTLKRRTVTLLAGVGIFAASIWSATLLPTEFIPPEDTGRAQLSIELPPGSRMDDTRETARTVTERLESIPEVDVVFVNGAETTATVTIGFGSKTTRERTSFQIIDDIEAAVSDIPDTRLFVMNENGARDITVSVLGDDAAATADAARIVAEAMNALPEVRGASSAAALVRPEIQISPRPELASQMGVTAVALAQTIRIATLGDTAGSSAKFTAGDTQIPILVRMKRDVREDLYRMVGLRVPTASGAMVPLGAVADVRLATGPTQVERYDRQYRTTIEADLEGDALLGPATAAVTALTGTLALPEGTRIQPGGDAEIMGEVFTQFGLAMGAGILFVYVVLVLLFSSFITPVTILASLPLAIGGAIFALYVYGAGIGLSVVIGFLMLMGIVTKNAIMLVEFALEAIARGQTRSAAILDAGHKRARPIIMTTIAMTAGMVPSALALGEGGEFRAPMAVAVIGGLLLSTLLSLVFVPSLFSAVNGLRDRLRRGLARGVNSPAE